jgi:uncharacterized protein YkwD
VKYVLSLGLFFMLVACGEVPLVTPENAPSNEPVNTPIQPALSAELQTLLVLVNDVRAKGHDCGDKGVFLATGPLTINANLRVAAQKHSVDLDATKVKTNMHVTPAGAVNYTPGMTFTQRVDAEKYKWASVGENVAYGYSTPQTVMEAWLASPGHCKNIMNPGFTELGLGKEGSYWTQVFASPL